MPNRVEKLPQCVAHFELRLGSRVEMAKVYPAELAAARAHLAAPGRQTAKSADEPR